MTADNQTTPKPDTFVAGWNGAVEHTADIVGEAVNGHGPLWRDHDDGSVATASDVLDRLHAAIINLYAEDRADA